MDRLPYHWQRIQENKDAFDDFTQCTYEQFVDIVAGPSSASFEIGDGLGLCTFVFGGTNAWIQMVVYDYGYRDYLCHDLCAIAFALGATRITSVVTEDRASARELVRDRMHAKYEGTIRQAFTRGDGKFLDGEVYGLLKEEFES